MHVLVGVASDADIPTPRLQGDDNQLLASEIISADDDLSAVANFA